MTICNEIIYIELGMLSIKTRVKIKQWKFWKNISSMNDDNPLMYIIKEARKHKLKEVRYYDELVDKYSSVEDIVEKFFVQTRSEIRNKAEKGQSKYITYLKINPTMSTPEIYQNITSHKHVSMIGKLRTSSHNLRVEMGRRQDWIGT